MKVSVIASAYRPHLWGALLKSLEGSSVSYEVVFVGPNDPMDTDEHLRFIKSTVKPAQCYEIARRHATGEVIHWTADDAEYTKDCLGIAYRFFKEHEDESVIVSMQTKENGHFYHMPEHRFFGGNNGSPLMAPLGFMSSRFLEKLGGFDRRFLYGQWENDVVMRAMVAGGRVVMYQRGDAWIELDHIRKHGENRLKDVWRRERAVLEETWKEPFIAPSVAFEPYSDKDILTISQCPGLLWQE